MTGGVRRSLPAVAPSSSERVVLVVDDDDDVSLLCRLHLEQAAFRVITAADGAVGLAMARDVRPSAVVLDFQLPEMDGLSIVAALRADPVTADIPVVMLTARVNAQDQQAAWDAGVSDYLLKPFEGSRLVDAVRVAVASDTESDRFERRAGALSLLRGSDVEMRQHLASIVEHAHDAIISTTLDGLITSWNAGATETFGYEAGEIIGRPISILASRGIADEPPDLLGRISRGEHVTQFESVRYSKDGRRIDVSLSASAVEDATGVVTGMSVIARDVTGRRQSEAKFRALVETAPDAMVIVDDGGLIQLVNAQTENLFGYGPDELVGGPVEQLVPERFRSRHPGHRIGYTGSPRVRPMGASLELYGLRKDGTEFPVEISLSPLQTDEGLTISASIRDVTERTRAEETQAHAFQREREASQRLREVDRLRSDFLSTVSHELRTPLTTIKGFADMLTSDWTSFTDDQKRDFMERISSAGSRLDNLIGDLLDFTRLERGQLKLDLESLDVAELVADAVRRVGPVLDEHVVDVDVDPGLMAVADALAFGHCIENLLINAAKFSHEGSSITVRARSDGDQIAVTVGDDGIGIPEDEIERIFERFYRVGPERNHRTGTGIGLAIVKDFTEAQGGSVTVTSLLGEGSQFTLSLPAG